MKIIEGRVIPGIGIGIYLLNISKDELLEMIGNDYKETKRKKDSIISIENAKFWVTKNGNIDQIGVGKGFQGTYKNIIGIGSTLAEVNEKVGKYIEIGDTYEIENEKGICFELEDIEEWEERTAPIEYIYVYRV